MIHPIVIRMVKTLAILTSAGCAPDRIPSIEADLQLLDQRDPAHFRLRAVVHDAKELKATVSGATLLPTLNTSETFQLGDGGDRVVEAVLVALPSTTGVFVTLAATGDRETTRRVVYLLLETGGAGSAGSAGGSGGAGISAGAGTSADAGTSGSAGSAVGGGS